MTLPSLLESYDKKEELLAELDENAKKAQVYRTQTEMEISVLKEARHSTPDSKYWQCVKEQAVMYHELKKNSFDYREKEIELELLERAKKQEKDGLKIRLIDIKIERVKENLIALEIEGKDRFREILMWSAKKKELEPLLKYGTEDCDKHQLESYAHEFIMHAAMCNDYTPPGDRRNLVGKADAAIRACKKAGILSHVLEGFGLKTLEHVENQIGFLLPTYGEQRMSLVEEKKFLN